MKFDTGERVGRYEILRKLGQGGFGVLYSAIDSELGREIAFDAAYRCGKDVLAAARVHVGVLERQRTDGDALLQEAAARAAATVRADVHSQ